MVRAPKEQQVVPQPDAGGKEDGRERKAAPQSRRFKKAQGPVDWP
jgi:hypothetical protein